MVLDRLAADEQPIGDLGVRQPVAEELEHLGLALGQHARRPCRRSTAGRPSERSTRRGGVGVGGPPAAARTRRARRGPRRSRPRAARRRARWRARGASWASSIGICARAKPASASRRQARGSPVPVARQTRAAGERRRGRAGSRLGWRAAHAAELGRGGLGAVELAGREVHVDEQRQQRRGGRARRVDLRRARARATSPASAVSPARGGSRRADERRRRRPRRARRAAARPPRSGPAAPAGRPAGRARRRAASGGRAPTAGPPR